MAEQVELGVLDFGEWQKSVVKSPVVVGRKKGVDIEVANERVSKRHVELRREGEGFEVVDLGSSNGTSVDGVKLEPNVRALVKWGSEIRLGLGEGVGFRVLRPVVADEEEPRTAEVPPPSFDEGISQGHESIAPQVAVEATGKRRGRRPGFTLSQRDLDVLEWIAVHRWSTQAILLDAFFAKPDPSKVKKGRKPTGKYGRERLWALEREGYIQPSRYRVGSVVPLLVSPRGYNLLHGQGRVEWAHSFPDIDSSRFEHELLIQTLRLKLEGLRAGVMEWKSERQLSWVNRVKHLPFVPDAQFKAGGRTWNLEVERTLKSKKRRQKGVDVRAKYYDERFLYVVPESIWSAVRESIKAELFGFEGGVYWLSEANAKQGRMTVRCRWSEWGEMALAELLGGKFEPELAQRRKAKDEADALKDLRAKFQPIAWALHQHISMARGAMQAFTQQLATRSKGVMGVGADKIQPLKFESTKTLQTQIDGNAELRRAWREKRKVEVPACKKVEEAFAVYASALVNIEAEIAKAIAEKKVPSSYKLLAANELEQALKNFG